MNHRRFSSLTGQRIHVTRPHRQPGFFRRAPADSFHIRSQKRIHTGNTDHNYRRLLLPAFTDLFYRFRDLLQVTASHDIRLIHQQIEEPVMIFPHRTDHRSISSATSGCHDQHNRSWYRKPCTLYPESFRTRRVECQCCRRTVDQMCI